MPGQSPRQQPSTEIDLYDEAVHPTVDDDFLQGNNLGLGNYTNSEYWQQVQSFAQGLFGDSAFGRLITDRAIDETKRKLATEGWSYTTEKGDKTEFDPWTERNKWDDHQRRQAIRERGEDIFQKLSDERKLEAVSDKVGLRNWTPPQWRMLMMRHEGSRSRGARVLDNLFGRIREERVADETSDPLEGEV